MKLFWSFIILNLISNINYRIIKNNILSFIFIAILIILAILWIKTSNDAWKSINKKHGWVPGLLIILPFGALIGITITYFTLKNTDAWRSKYKNFKIEK